MYYKFTFEDGSEAFAHYGVKGMKWDKHVMAQDPAYLESLGMAVPGGAEFNPMNALQNIGQTVSDGVKAVGDGVKAANDTITKFRNWKGPEGLPTNPLHSLSERIKKAEASGEADAARKRLIERYGGKKNKGNSSEKTNGQDKKLEKALKKKRVDDVKAKADGIKAKKRPTLDPTEYGFENTVQGRRAARGEMFGRLAEKGKMSKERATEMAKKDYEQAIKDAKGNKQRIEMAKKQYDMGTKMANTFKTRQELNAESERRNQRYAAERAKRERETDYKNETKVNKMENWGDKKGFREQQALTNDYFGKNGKAAQAAEVKRRRRNREYALRYL